MKRVIVHPAFKNISFKEAERLLDEMDQGECIVRLSSKVTMTTSQCYVTISTHVPGDHTVFLACVAIALDWLEAESQRSNERWEKTLKKTPCGPRPIVTLFNIAN